jgi:hypothetical protein
MAVPRLIGLLRLLRQFPLDLLLEPPHAVFGGQVFVTLGKNPAPRALRLNTAFVEIIHPAILLYQCIMVFVDVFDNGIELLAREAGHRPVDEVKVVAAVKVVEHIHYRQSMPFDLWAAAEINDLDFFRVHGIALYERYQITVRRGLVPSPYSIVSLHP